MLKAILNKINNRLKVYSNYSTIARQIPFLKDTANIPANAKVAVVDFASRRLERHFYFILKFLSDSGYQILMVDNKISIGCWVMYGKQLVALPNVHLIADVPAMHDGWLYFTDAANPKEVSKGKRVHVRIDVARADTSKPNTLIMPLPMSVEVYASDAHKNLNIYRQNRKLMKAVYSGNLDSAYNSETLHIKYQNNTRLEIINEVKAKLNSDEMMIFNDVSQYHDLTQDIYLNKFVLFDWFWNGGNSNLKARIDNTEWLETLSQSDFFLGCPGIAMPPTHAVVEAMSVGCIPILQWPEFFAPHLTDNVNCIVFKDMGELIVKIKEALAAPQERIEQLRKNVIDYYEQHLSPTAYIRKIEACGFPHIEYYLYTDYSHLV